MPNIQFFSPEYNNPVAGNCQDVNEFARLLITAARKNPPLKQRRSIAFAGDYNSPVLSF